MTTYNTLIKEHNKNKDDIVGINEQLAENMNKIENIENETIGGYVEADIKSVNDLISQNKSYNDIAFGFVTDSHGYTNHLKAIAEISEYGQIDFVVHGGDSIAGESSLSTIRDSLSKTTKVLSKIKQPVFCLRGNHDSDSSGALTIKEFCNRMVFPYRQNSIVLDTNAPENGYYYRDFENYKIRAIFINTASIPIDGTVQSTSTFYRWGIDSIQLQWIANVALDLSSKSTDKGNWGVIVFGHHNTRQRYSVSPPTKNGDVLESILKAFKGGTSYNHANTGVNINYSTQGAMNLIGYVFGHTHYDVMEIPSDLGYPMISTACSHPSYYETPPEGNQSYPRAQGTDTEDAWDVFVINLAYKLIKAKRYGAGIDRSISYKYLLVDTFNRVNSANGGIGVADTGQEWVQQSGKFAILGNKAVKSEGGTTGGLDQAVIDTGKSNIEIKSTITWKTANSGGLSFRNTDNSNFIQAVISISGIIVSKYVNGVSSQIGSYGFTPTDGQTYEIKVVANGNNIVISVDGVERINITETFNNIGTKHGIRVPSGLLITFEDITIQAL